MAGIASRKSFSDTYDMGELNRRNRSAGGGCLEATVLTCVLVDHLMEAEASATFASMSQADMLSLAD